MFYAINHVIEHLIYRVMDYGMEHVTYHVMAWAFA